MSNKGNGMDEFFKKEDPNVERIRQKLMSNDPSQANKP
jgi:hypothetical protein